MKETRSGHAGVFIEYTGPTQVMGTFVQV